MGAFGAIIISVLAVTVAVLLVMYVVVPTFRGVGWLIRHVFTFIGGMIGDVLRAIGSIIVIPIYSIAVLGNIVIGRWSAAAHFGRSVQDEIATIARSVYGVLIGRPARFLLLGALVEGLEQRVPQAFANTPGPDKPSRKTGQFEGYTIVGSLKGGGSGARLYIAEPDERRLAAFDRAGHPGVERVVIKAFSMSEGSSLPQIIRESRALEAARDLGLILDHGMTEARFFYVMPYVPGDDLNVVTRRLHERAGSAGLSDDSLREAVGYVVDLLATLDRYHRGGLWHKDVKPDNIIVHNGEAHLVDLGLVTPLRSAMTLTTHGTEYFRDPEMVRMALKGVKVHQVDGAKFDIFAAGAVLYSIIENSFPMHGGLSQVTKRCPEGLRWTIRRAMTDYNNRYASAGAMLRDLKAVLASGDLFAVRPADLPSVKDGDSPDLPEAEPLAAASVPAADAPTEKVKAAPAAQPPAPEPAVPAAAPAAARSPRIRVKNWWTGGFDLDPDDHADPKDRSRVFAFGIGVGKGARTRRAGSPVPPRNRDAAPGGRSLTPAEARLPAREQLRRAQQRIHAAQTRARERMQRRSRTRPRHVNGGVFAALFVAACLGAAVIGFANREEIFNNARRNVSITIEDDRAADVRSQTSAFSQTLSDAPRRITRAEVERSLAQIGDEFGAFLVDLQSGLIEPAIQGARAAVDSSGAVPAPESGAGRWLVLSDIGPGSDDALRRKVERALGVLSYRGWSLIGLGDSERDVELTASARKAIGLEVSEAPQRLAEWLSQQGEALAGVLWLTLDDTANVSPVIVHRRDAQPVPIEEALRGSG